MTHDIDELKTLLDQVTPGQWSIPGQPDKVCVDGYTGNGWAKVIAIVNDPAWMGHGEPYANASLIAMSPALARRVIAAEKLADALREVTDTYREADNGRHLRWAVDAANAALTEWEQTK